MITFPEAVELQVRLRSLEKINSLDVFDYHTIERTIDLLEVVKRIDFYTTAQPPIEHPELPLT